jgi:translation initiation factor IF-3
MPSAPQLPSRDGPRVNEDIRVPQVRLIDQNGEMLGVMTSRDALYRAYSVGLDLLEISPNAVPPVCKITDYGKFKYEQQKKANEARKKQKVVEIKEIKVRPNIDDHDYDTKMKQMKGFIADGDKVKVTLRFRGREMAHMEIGMELLQKVKRDTESIGKVEQEPKLEGRQMVMVIAPKSVAG